ncbi:MAG: OmpH family outer membrane protein [Planctomycetota bacterium]|nr:OmpH family outer membrane protein [Planctomycetota bacterium]
MKAMHRRINWPAALLLALLAGFVAYQTQAHRASASAPPAVVATVNIERLFQNLDERSAADTRLTALAEELDAETQRRQEEIERLNEELEIYAPGSQQHRELNEQIALKGYQLQAFLDFAMRKLDNEKSKFFRGLYDRIKQAVAATASENGYDVVFVDDSIVDLPRSATEEEMKRQISARRMLFATNQIDITDQLVERMNREFNQP